MNASLHRFVLTAGLCAAMAASAAAQTPAPSPVSVSGVVYAQYGYQMKDTAAHLNQFDVTRAYVNVIGKFSGGIQTRVTLDINHATAPGSSQVYRLKYAFAAWNPQGSDLTFKMGLFTTPWIDWEEALWDYRMQGPTILDRAGYLSSSNFGLGVDGNIQNEMVDFQAGVFDNGSYSSGPGDQRKDLQGRVSVRVMNTDDMSRVGGLRITGFGQVGHALGGGSRSRFVGMVSYKSKMLTLAGLFAATKDTISPLGAAFGLNMSGTVIGGYGVLKVPNSPVSLLARVDYLKPNKDTVSTLPGFDQTRIIAGASYQLSPNVRLLADLDLLSYKNGSPTPALEAARQQALFQAQFTF